ncbi:unnamed protein product [Rhizophagus irregularis]|nr:unnamed protein product [Rhizophagus irregularis]
MLNTRNLNNREFKRIGSRIMAKVYFNKFITLKEIVKEIIEVNFCKNITHFYGTIRVMEYADSDSTNSCYTAKDNVDISRTILYLNYNLGEMSMKIQSNIHGFKEKAIELLLSNCFFLYHKWLAAMLTMRALSMSNIHEAL